MKKLSLTAFILLIAFSGIYAQQNSQKIHYKVEGDVPIEVLQAIEANHRGLNLKEHLLQLPATPQKLENNKNIWSVSHPYYVVHTTGKNYKKRELYNRNGELTYSRERIWKTSLPVAIRQHIGQEYNGWQVKRSRAVRTIDSNNQQTTYYKVLLQNGKQKQNIMLDEQGKIYVRRQNAADQSTSSSIRK